MEGRTTLGDCLNRGVEAASGVYVAEMDDDDHYGKRYLSDHVLAASFSDAEVVGRDCTSCISKRRIPQL